MQREFNNENKRRRSVTAGFKRAAIKHFEISGVKNVTALRFKVSRQQIQQWVKNKEVINDPNNKKSVRRIPDKAKIAKRAKYHEIESQVNEYVLNQRYDNRCVTIKSIQTKMKELMAKLLLKTENAGK
jgi:hypothetical protein